MQKLARSLQKRGALGTVRIAVAHFLSPAYMRTRQAWRHYIETRFDRKFRVDTAGIVRYYRNLSTDPYYDAGNYQAASQRIFNRIMKALDIDHQRFVFVDVGCGKGKILLLAARFPFQQILGVELSPALARTAVKNTRTYQTALERPVEFKVECLDAADWQVPPEPLILFLYNPFGEQTLGRLLAKIRESLREHPRELYLLYYNPEFETAVAQCDFLKRVTVTGKYVIYASTAEKNGNPC